MYYRLLIFHWSNCTPNPSCAPNPRKWNERRVVGTNVICRIAKLTIFGKAPLICTISVMTHHPVYLPNVNSHYRFSAFASKRCVHIYRRGFRSRLQMRRHLQRIPTNQPLDLLERDRDTSVTLDRVRQSALFYYTVRT